MSDADPVTVAILVDGSAIADDVQISAITVAHGINAIPGATITIADGGPADADCACASTPDRHRANRCRELGCRARRDAGRAVGSATLLEGAIIMGEKIIIIGGSSGIGLAAARRFKAEGYDVIISSRSRARIDAALTEIGGGAGYCLDYAEPDTIAAFFDRAGGHSHLVLAAAGEPAWGLFQDLSVTDFRTAFDTKFWGYVTCLQRALPALHDSGSVTLIGGAAGRTAVPGMAGLAAVNGAIERMGITLARELAPRRVNVLSPGLVATPAYDDWPSDRRDAMYRDAASSLPAGRVGVPDDIAEALLFLVRSSFVTGAVLDVDGGVRLG